MYEAFNCNQILLLNFPLLRVSVFASNWTSADKTQMPSLRRNFMYLDLFTIQYNVYFRISIKIIIDVCNSISNVHLGSVILSVRSNGCSCLFWNCDLWIPYFLCRPLWKRYSDIDWERRIIHIWTIVFADFLCRPLWRRYSDIDWERRIIHIWTKVFADLFCTF
jgi:hypothetical protein